MRTLLSLALAAFLSFFSFTGHAQSGQLPPLVSVSGVGEVKVQPDQVQFVAGVEVREQTLEDARRNADQRTTAIISALKKSGVEEKHIQTAYLSIQPMYTGEYGQTKPQFYLATRSISVTLNKLNKYDEVMSALYKAGANQVHGISYQSSNLKKHQEEARRKAVQEAKQKATMLASELGAKVGRVYQINEGGASAPGPILYGKMALQERAMDAGGSTIAAGEMTITSQVEVSFVLE
ncbi:SIMPL domain-containing protein [Rufibacter ruber]|uniref:SIMPL domain-containing protein n=1 Tax=Rufibacter ruber TaxID=1783499 RepID=UPI0008295D24|nr:SIMPL domain-containing protein [Rufibacter ruber]